MTTNHPRVWYDMTMALTYTSVLGAVIYSFFDSIIRVFSLYPIVEISRFHFFEAFGLNSLWGLIAYLAITLCVILHYSADYLYSKYSEGQYGLFNFICDTIIAFLLAAGYITLSNNMASTLNSLRFAFAIFWLALSISYLIFILWDFRAYRQYRNTNLEWKHFYLGMYSQFDLSALILFSILFIVTSFVMQDNWFGSEYILVSTVTLLFYSLWFSRKVMALEKLSRES